MRQFIQVEAQHIQTGDVILLNGRDLVKVFRTNLSAISYSIFYIDGEWKDYINVSYNDKIYKLVEFSSQEIERVQAL